MRFIYYVFLLFFTYFSAHTLYAQEKTFSANPGIALAPDEENLNVFQQWIRWNNPGSLLINHLTKQAMDHYEIRDREIAKLKTKEDWLGRQNLVKNKLNEIMGPFPERNPLNPRITGTIKKDGYRIEKIVYEAMPGYYVTGCLYVPDKVNEKVPAILNLMGHNQEAFRNPLYQVINYNLVKKGMIVFTIDPPGQGEHVQYFDQEIGFSSIGYTVIEHCYFGNQCFLSGSSAAKYFIWEGIRAIDYLVSLKEVDPERIGVTGFSGGGTITTYIGAYDERVKVAIPSSWSTTNRRQMETKGVQDSDAIFPHGVVKGITLEDLLEVRAPKPTLLTFTSRDEYLTMQGALEAYSEAKGAFEAMGMADNLEMVDDDSKHWLTSKIRLAMYTFFMKHFDISGDPEEEEADIFSEKELTVTATGQISTDLGGKMIFDVNKKESEILIQHLEESRKNIEKHLKDVNIRAKEISGYIAPEGGDGNPFINGKYQRDGYSVGKYAIMGEGNYPIPILLFVPDNLQLKHPALVYLHSQGKDTEAKAGGEIEKLVKKGYVVAATDVLGVGETKNRVANRQGTADAGNTAMLIGRSVVGIQAGDIIRVVNYLKSRPEIDSSKIGGIGLNELCIPLIHAAAFEPSINNITLIGSPISYRSIVMNEKYKVGLIPTENRGTGLPYELDFSSTIAGVLTAYDLPDLIACIAPRKVSMVDIKNHLLENASDELINQDMGFPNTVYADQGVPGHFRIITSADGSGSNIDWGFK